MQNITFTSSIRPLTLAKFEKETANITRNVTRWDIEGAKKGISAKTDRIMDCTALGLTDGEKVFLMHITPDKSSDKAYFSKIVECIKNNIDINSEYIQGLLVGSKKYSRESQIGYNNFVKFLKEQKVPFSELKGGETVHKIGYHTSKDEWLVSNYDIDCCIRNGLTDTKSILEQSFDKVKINKLDDFAWT